MAKNPANRYQSAAEMRADVERALSGRPVEATPILADQPTTYVPPVAATTVLQRVGPERQRRRTLAYALLVLAVIGVFVAAAFIAKAWFSGESSGSVATPNLIGLTVDQASQKLTTQGLVLGKVDDRFSTEQKGRILEQSPVDGIALNKGGRVDVVVSKGVEQVRIPSIVGKSQSDATKDLEKAKLQLGTVTERDDPHASGTVLEQSPAPGNTVNAGSKVDIVVASGQAPIPDVTGLSENEATQQLEDAGFRVATRERVDDTVPEGTVLEQSPSGGGDRTASRGSTVTITLAKAAPTPTPTPTPTPSPTPLV